MIFGVWNPEKIWHQQVIHLPTLPVYCNHFTLGNPKKSAETILDFSRLTLLDFFPSEAIIIYLQIG